VHVCADKKAYLVKYRNLEQKSGKPRDASGGARVIPSQGQILPE
jgi:hypothetical protein